MTPDEILLRTITILLVIIGIALIIMLAITFSWLIYNYEASDPWWPFVTIIMAVLCWSAFIIRNAKR